MMKTFVISAVLLLALVSANSQTTYTWTGSVNSSFSTAGNWTPFRQIGLVTDILLFESGATVNAMNVSSVTVGQIIVRNNTNVIISPSIGNPKTISITGAAGNDFVVENGSSFTISGNDPSINILVKTGATAQISGTINLNGEINHTINAVDSLSIRFKNGSTFNQNCPGSIFTTSGMKNAVVFENGSQFVVNHLNALNPFGLSAPDSKVKFEGGSNFVLKTSASNALSVSGRNYGNVTITNESNLTVSENMTAAFTAGSLSISDGSMLRIINRSVSNSARFEFGGNIDISGSFGLNDTNAILKNIEIILNGIDNTISGNGPIPTENLKSVTVNGNYSLNRDLAILSTLILNGHVNRNGHEFTVTGKIIDNSVFSGLSGGRINDDTPRSYKLSQNYPNPFNPSTKIDYTLAADSKVTIKVYDVTGREVMTILDAVQNAGDYSISVDAKNLTSGAYFYKLTAEANGKTFSSTKKMILAR
jgi:hypothetical protein